MFQNIKVSTLNLHLKELDKEQMKLKLEEKKFKDQGRNKE